MSTPAPIHDLSAGQSMPGTRVPVRRTSTVASTARISSTASQGPIVIENVPMSAATPIASGRSPRTPSSLGRSDEMIAAQNTSAQAVVSSLMPPTSA